MRLIPVSNSERDLAEVSELVKVAPAKKTTSTLRFSFLVWFIICSIIPAMTFTVRLRYRLLFQHVYGSFLSLRLEIRGALETLLSGHLVDYTLFLVHAQSPSLIPCDRWW